MSIHKCHMVACLTVLGGTLLGTNVALANTTIPIKNYDFSYPTLNAGSYQATGAPPGLHGWIGQDNGAGGLGGVENDNLPAGSSTSKWTSTTLANWPATDTGQALLVGNTFPGTTLGDYVYYDVTTNSPGNPTWQPNTKYTLTLYYGEPIPHPTTSSDTSADIALGTAPGGVPEYTSIGETGSNLVAVHNNITATSGDLQEWSATGTTGSTVPNGDMMIYLVNADTGTQPANGGTYTQAFFTDIQLTASPVPDPATGSLLVVGVGLLLLLGSRRRQTIH